jgi:hypothetical protein
LRGIVKNMKRLITYGILLLALAYCTYLLLLHEKPDAHVTGSESDSNRSLNARPTSVNADSRRNTSNRRDTGGIDTEEITQEEFDDFQNASVDGSNSYEDFVSFLGKIKTEKFFDLAVGVVARAESLKGKEKASLGLPKK